MDHLRQKQEKEVLGFQKLIKRDVLLTEEHEARARNLHMFIRVDIKTKMEACRVRGRAAGRAAMRISGINKRQGFSCVGRKEKARQPSVCEASVTIDRSPSSRSTNGEELWQPRPLHLIKGAPPISTRSLLVKVTFACRHLVGVHGDVPGAALAVVVAARVVPAGEDTVSSGQIPRATAPWTCWKNTDICHLSSSSFHALSWQTAAVPRSVDARYKN